MRWGVIGLGVGLQHAHALERMPGARLVAICDRDPEVLGRAHEGLPGTLAFGDQQELIKSGEVDAVVVATYDNEHAGAILDCIDSDLHVFSEKPMATSREDLETLCDALGRHRGVRLSTNTLLRRSPRFAWLKEQIAAGTLGGIFHVEGDYLYGRLQKLATGWRGRDPKYSVTLGGAVHIVDLVMWLTSERPRRVSAIGSGKGLRDSNQAQDGIFDGNDFRMALLEFDSGLTAKVSANFACVMPHFHSLSVFGSAGSFIHAPGSRSGDSSSSVGYLFSGRDEADEVSIIDLPYPAVPKSHLLCSFSRALSESLESEIVEQEVLDVVAVCLAIDDSVRARKPVDVSYVPVAPRIGHDGYSLGGG